MSLGYEFFMPLELALGDFYVPGGGIFLCPWSLEFFYAPCPWSWESFMPLELGEFYMYALESGEFYAPGFEKILHVCP